MKKLTFYRQTFFQTFQEWNKSNASKDAMGLAYSAIFSIPGLLIIVIWIVGIFLGEEAIQGEISRQIGDVMGQDAAQAIETMITNSMVQKDGFLMKSIGIVSLVFGATTLFFRLQQSLNELWGVEPVPKKALYTFITDRANSLGMILIVGFLMVITMILTTAISVFNNIVTHYVGGETYSFIQLVNFVLGFIVVIFIFALIFKVLPDLSIPWKAVWTGALVSALLFTIGRFALSYYFTEFKPTSTFGAAGAAILVMMWVNYSCLLLFFGAMFTKVYSEKMGWNIQPSKHAQWNDRCDD